jgi:hypothetical protein
MLHNGAPATSVLNVASDGGNSRMIEGGYGTDGAI